MASHSARSGRKAPVGDFGLRPGSGRSGGSPSSWTSVHRYRPKSGLWLSRRRAMASASASTLRISARSGFGGATRAARSRSTSNSGSVIGTLSNSSQSQSPPVPSRKSRKKPATSPGVRSTVFLPGHSRATNARGTEMGMSRIAAHPVIARPELRCIQRTWLNSAMSAPDRGCVETRWLGCLMG